MKTRAYTVNLRSALIVRGQITVQAANARDAAAKARAIADENEDALSNAETESGRFVPFRVYRAETDGGPSTPTDSERLAAVRAILYADGPETSWTPETLDEIARAAGKAAE